MTDTDIDPKAIREEAAIWEAQQPTLANAASAALGYTIAGAEVGFYGVVADSYNAAVDFIADNLSQGAAMMTAIGSNMRMNAAIYEGNEQELAAEYAKTTGTVVTGY